MRKWVWSLVLTALVAAPAAAQEKNFVCSVGYAFATYLEEGGGSAPFGLYGSLASSGRQVGFDADVAYHRDSESFFGFSIVLNTLTAAVGPRFEVGSGNAKPYLHTLAGLRYDRIEGESNTSFGGMAGGGVDIPGGSNISWRLGADFQIFFDEGENLKTLRLIGGVTF